MERSIKRDDGLDPLDGSAVGAADLTLFAEDLRTAFPETPLPERMAEDHIAAMIGSIQLLAEKGESALEPTSNAHGPDRRASGLPKLRRRTMKERMIVTLAVTMGLLLSLAGLANAGVLPDPIQGAVGSVLGINDEGEQGNVDDGAVEDVDEGDQGNIDDDAQGDTDDDAQGDVDEGDQGEDGDDQGEDGDDQGEDGDDQGEDGDDQGEDSDDADDADDQGEDSDDADDADDQGDDADDSGDEGSDE